MAQIKSFPLCWVVWIKWKCPIWKDVTFRVIFCLWPQRQPTLLNPEHIELCKNLFRIVMDLERQINPAQQWMDSNLRINFSRWIYIVRAYCCCGALFVQEPTGQGCSSSSKDRWSMGWKRDMENGGKIGDTGYHYLSTLIHTHNNWL